MQVYRNVGIHLCRFAGMQVSMDACIQGYRYAGM